MEADVRKIWSLAVLGLIAAPTMAHDFWIQPRLFTMPAPSSEPLVMFVGHGQARDRWGLDASHVVLFRTIGPDGMIDRRANLKMGATGFDAIVPLARPGAYVFVLQSNSTASQLPSLRFNDYISAEGITPIIAQRQRFNQGKADGREIYSRRAKAIVQVGPVDAASIARVTRPVNLALEIVPERHPQALDSAKHLPVRVLFNGRPLAGATVKLTDLDADAEPVAKIRTGADGRAVFTIPHPGKWQFNVVWAVALNGNPQADYATTFSSLALATN